MSRTKTYIIKNSVMKLHGLKFLVKLMLIENTFKMTSSDLRIGYITNDYNHGAVTLGIEQAQRDGYHIGLNIRYYNVY